jgi:YCII-related domain
VGGYWVIEVKSREEALEWASRIPGRDTDMIEVRRFFEMSDFGVDAQQNIEEFEKKTNDAGTNAPSQ